MVMSFVVHNVVMGICCGGDRCGRWSLFIVVVVGSGRGQSLSCALMVVVKRKEATSHIMTMASQLTFHVRSHVNVSHVNDLM